MTSEQRHIVRGLQGRFKWLCVVEERKSLTFYDTESLSKPIVKIHRRTPSHTTHSLKRAKTEIINYAKKRDEDTRS